MCHPTSNVSPYFKDARALSVQGHFKAKREHRKLNEHQLVVVSPLLRTRSSFDMPPNKKLMRMFSSNIQSSETGGVGKKQPHQIVATR